MEKLAYGLRLLFVQIVGRVHDVLQVFQVAEEIFGLYHILVHIIEIAYQEFTPKVEVVQRLRALGLLTKHFVELAHQTNRVSVLQRRHAFEEVADADVCGRPQRTVALCGQVFVEEQGGPFVRKDNGRAAQVVSYIVVEVFGDHLEECFHDVLYKWIFFQFLKMTCKYTDILWKIV